MNRSWLLRGAKLLSRRLEDLITADRLVVALSLTALYGQQASDVITVGPLVEIATVVGPTLSSIDPFYWTGVAMMYFIHLLSIRAVYEGFDIELLKRYPSFHHAFAVIATLVAQYVLVSSLPSRTAPAYLQQALTTHSITVVGPFVGLLVFAKVRTEAPLTDPDSSYLSILPRIGVSREELIELHEATDIRRFAPYLVVGGVTGLYFVPLTLMGSFTATLRIYPGVLEVLAIVAVIGSKALRTSKMGEQRVDLADRFEQAAAFDSPFYDVISETPIGAGWGYILALLFGTLLVPLPILLLPTVGSVPLDTFVTGLRGLVFDTAIPTAQAIGMLTRALFWVVFTSTPYLGALFGLWFWYQTARRAPSIIQRRAAKSEARDYDGDVDLPPVARPRGWLLPLVGLLLVTFSHPLYQVHPGLPIAALHAPGVQIAAWVAALGLFGWCIVATAAAEPRRSRHPTIELLLPSVLVAGTLVYAQRQWDLLPAYGVLFGVILFMMYSEEFLNWMQAPSRRTRILRALPAGIFFAVGGWQAQGLVAGIGYGVVGGVSFIFVGEWRAIRQAESDAEPNEPEDQPNKTVE